MASRIIVGLGLDFVNGPIFSAIVMLLPPLGVGLLLTPCRQSGAVLRGHLHRSRDRRRGGHAGLLRQPLFRPPLVRTLYGLIFAAFVIGIGVGPAFLGFGHDHFHSYDPVLRVFFVALIIAAVLFLPLGKYIYPKGTQ